MRRRAGAHGNASTQAVLHRRMSFANPDVASITKIWGSAGGAGGVAFLSDGDGKPLVVKNEDDARDVVQVSAILSGVLGGKRKKGKWSSKAPAARLATAAEVTALRRRAATRGVIKPGDRAFGIIGGLAHGKAVIFEGVPQPDFIKSFLGKQSKKKRFGRGRKSRSGSAFEMLRNRKYLRALGEIAAVDLFIGNFDRLAGMNNPQNWKVDAGNKAIVLIDNLEGTGLPPFAGWKAHPLVKALVAGRYDEIATNIATEMREGAIWAAQTLRNAGLVTDRARDIPGARGGSKIRQVDENYVLSKIVPRLNAPLEAGLAAGTKLLLRNVKDVLDSFATPNPELSQRYWHFMTGSSPSVRAKNKQ